MTGVALIAEGQRLARPCVRLLPQGESKYFAAVWRGPGQIPAGGSHYEHCLTVDCRFLPSGVGPSSGCLSVYTDEEDRFGKAVHDDSAKLERTREGRPLFAHPTISLPPLEAVFLYGSAAVREWLTRLGWQPEWGWNGNFPDAEVADAYIEAQRVNLPIDGETVFAVLGGWHVPWPDGDWLELVDHPLVVLTLAESEPWVEVFNMGDSFRVIQRIS
jgi:hypothetical protein